MTTQWGFSAGDHDSAHRQWGWNITPISMTRSTPGADDDLEPLAINLTDAFTARTLTDPVSLMAQDSVR
jgi:hypothetical protein